MKINHIFLGFMALCLSWQTAQSQDGFLLKDGETFVFLGDSITQAASTPEGYITLIQSFCGINGYDIKAINAGIGGHKSNDMLARLEKDVLSHNPDWVSISCGVNDVWHQFKPEPSGVSLSDYKKNITEIVERCQKSGAKVLLLTATPIYEDLNSEQNKKLRPYNDFLRELAKEKKLILCDLFAAFEKLYEKKLNGDNLLTTDGVHMLPRGNRLMAREILKSLGANDNQLRQAEKAWELINNMHPIDK
jgi:lysophospholipase L1-like esterase